ncbi:MAG: MerR family transcriptional regulator [Candidatus Zixiibacteriota bacterium]
MEKRKLHSSELAGLAGVNKETIRFYERKGLLPEPERTSSGYRIYTDDDLKRLQFIRNAQQLGFNLKEINELLEISDGKISGCAEVKKLAEMKVEFISAQIKSLSRLRRVLNDLIKQCSGKGGITHCPIIDSLSSKRTKSED